ncbi:hypothetical protein FRC17_008145, partial [Serendipita sp. 399]
APTASSHLSPPAAKSIRPSVSYHGLANAAAQDYPDIRSLQEELEMDQQLDTPEAGFVGLHDEVTTTTDPPLVTVSEPVENSAVAAIRTALDPQNQGRPLEEGEHILPVGSLEGSPSESFYLLSHAVNARPTKWGALPPKQRDLLENSPSNVRNRRSPAPMSAERSPKDHLEKELGHSDTEDSETERDIRGEGGSRPGVRKMRSRIETLYTDSEAVPARRIAALSRLKETAADRSNRPARSRKSRSSRASQAGIEVGETEQNLQREPPTRRGEDLMPKDGWGRTLLEIWIVLQAAIILMVFVYSMARRGPRAILDAAEVNKRRPRSRAR